MVVSSHTNAPDTIDFSPLESDATWSSRQTGHVMQTPAIGSVKATFRLKLENEWRFKPRCNLKGHSTMCGCLRPFIKTGLLEDWMRVVELSKSNGEMLFEEINPIKTPLHSSASTILDGSILVFSWLVKEKHGRLIHIFHHAEFDDIKLRDTKHSLLDDKDLKHAYAEYKMEYPFTFEKLIEALDSSRWEFFPQHLGPKLENRAFGDKLYIPFCRQEAVTRPGATAAVHVAIIQEEFVADEVRDHMGPLVDGENYGPCYRLAIKRISGTRWNEYIQERRAFKGIRDKKGMLRCLGSYNFVDERGKEHYNILLEFADMNLHEYFMAFDPPQLADEVCSQWAEICEVAAAIETLHYFDYDGARWSGWHGDIKPRNLLRVGTEWKIADYGFTVFEAESGRAKLKECTETWGAPETIHQGVWVLQTVDTWSYGCVLSIMATWMVKGVKGVIEYQEYRSQDRPSDAFHNDGDVLPQIRIWHDHLKQLIRQSDYITEPILDVVEKHLLLKNPKARLKSRELKATLDNVIAGARNLLQNQAPMDNGLIKAIKDVQNHPTELMASYKSPTQDGSDSTISTGSLPEIGQLVLIKRPEKQSSQEVISPTEVLRPPEMLNASSASSDGSSEPELAYNPRFEDLQLSISGTTEGTVVSAPTPSRNDLRVRIDPQRGSSSLARPRTMSADQNSIQIISYSANPTSSVPLPLASSVEATMNDVWDAVNAVNGGALALRIILNGGNFRAARQFNGSQQTPIMVAAKNNNLDAVELLIEHSDLSLYDQEHKTVLHHIVEGQHGIGETPRFLKTLRCILDSKLPSEDMSSWVNWPNHLNHTCLFSCVQTGLAKATKQLVCKGALVAGVGTKPEDSPLFEAVRMGKENIVQIMLESNALDQGVSAELRTLLIKERKNVLGVWNSLRTRLGDDGLQESSRSRWLWRRRN